MAGLSLHYPMLCLRIRAPGVRTEMTSRIQAPSIPSLSAMAVRRYTSSEMNQGWSQGSPPRCSTTRSASPGGARANTPRKQSAFQGSWRAAALPQQQTLDSQSNSGAESRLRSHPFRRGRPEIRPEHQSQRFRSIALNRVFLLDFKNSAHCTPVFSQCGVCWTRFHPSRPQQLVTSMLTRKASSHLDHFRNASYSCFVPIDFPPSTYPRLSGSQNPLE